MIVTTHTVIQKSAVVLLARVRKDDGTYLQPYEVESMTFEVWDMDEGALIGRLFPDPMAVVTTELQTRADDPRWDIDAIGRNFAYTIPGSYFPQGNRMYQVQVFVGFGAGEYTGYEDFTMLWRLDTEKVFFE